MVPCVSLRGPESKTWCLLSAIQNEAVIYLQMYIKKTAVQEGSETGRTAQTASFILLLRQGSGPGAVETSQTACPANSSAPCYMKNPLPVQVLPTLYSTLVIHHPFRQFNELNPVQTGLRVKPCLDRPESPLCGDGQKLILISVLACYWIPCVPSGSGRRRLLLLFSKRGQ